MLCNTMSHYPDGVDQMFFFQDNSLDKIDIMNTYNNLIVQGKYTLAKDYINQQEGVYGYFADFFNAIENRIYNLQKYIVTKPAKVQPFFGFSESEYELNPDLAISKMDEGMFWI